jgi:hypothetical protein
VGKTFPLRCKAPQASNVIFSLPQFREFHMTPVMEGGRHSGHRSLEPKPRKFSKAQIKRKVSQREANKKKPDPLKMKQAGMQAKQLEAVKNSPQAPLMAQQIEDT